jgi:hypothetical protein
MASVGTMAGCQAERDRYGAQMGPMVDQMNAMSGQMDGCMSMMGSAGASSFGSVCGSMQAELARHMGAACASADMSANASEATAHAQRMSGWAQSESSEAATMEPMMTGGSCRM